MREEHGVPLSSLTTMRVGGPASRLVTVETTDELVDAVREVDDAGEPLLVLSGGSNLIVADQGFPGTVVRIATAGVTRESVDSCGGAMVRVAAGEDWDGLVACAVEQGWAGIEALSGIPGLTGATPIQNVGAYGQEVAQTVAQVRTWDREEQAVRTFFNADCRFGYRHSRFKGTDRFVVLDVLYQLEVADLSRPIAYSALAAGLGVPLGTRVPLADTRAAVLDQRRKRGMVLDAADHDTWSCGSFFTNP
ncbi:MAG TPA: UDP-N-acetylmuramate dehydrogenase, partial [Intrasporangium sp.]|uniref:UDP-N-acetylmuramate dehydrogenase n=1 Tax=Intrasporangium sp. TaxID=1925024 RepID=UPI002B47BDFC